MIIKNDIERANLIEGGKRLASVLEALRAKVAPGVTTEELDDFAEAMIRDYDDEPCFLGYTPEGGSRPYPATL
ncbi:MAG: type I methionyl aminopeptidase, partial [Patescibacteria group bacterium]